MIDIGIVKDDNGNIFISQQDLITFMSERLSRFPAELEELKKPKQSPIVGLDGNPKLIPSDPVVVAHHEGMQEMLAAILGVINVEK